jgi:peptidoglycan/xylan/chitin deacetylase (PgdA/CDA1 family)
MKSVAKNCAYQVLAQFAIPRQLHKRCFRHELTIVMYHGVLRSPLKIYNGCFLDESFFLYQMKYLKRHFEVISLLDAVERIQSGRIDQPTAVITFDDGFQNNYDICFPILHELRLPATIFLATGYINTSDTVWFCKLNRAMAETTRLSLDWQGARFNLSAPKAKAAASSLIQERLKQLVHPQLLTELNRIVTTLGCDPKCAIEIGSPYRMLSHTAIKEMSASGLIDFGAHTHTHAILSHLSATQRLAEIERSTMVVRELTGRPCELFSYPNGRAQDYDANVVQMLQSCGVSTSVTTSEGPNDCATSVMELKRYAIDPDVTSARFQMKVHHVLTRLQAIFR